MRSFDDDDDCEGVGPDITVSVVVMGKAARITGPANVLDFGLAVSQLLGALEPPPMEASDEKGRVFRLVEVKEG